MERVEGALTPDVYATVSPERVATAVNIQEQ